MKTRMTGNGWILAACATAALAAGCLSPSTAGVSAEKGVLRVEDRRFASHVEVVQDQTTTTDGGFLKVQVTLRNTGKRNFDCQYRFTWKDKDGMELKSAETHWKPLMLYGREEAVVQGICPVPRASEYRLVLRPAKDK